MSAPQYQEGDRVRLCAMPENGIGEEDGTVLSADAMSWGVSLVVLIDAPFRDGPCDDGLRELTEDQVVRRID